MALNSQKRLMGEMDRMNGRRVAKIARQYRSDVVGPLVKRIERGKSLKGLLKQLGPGLIEEMNAAALEEAIADTEVQMKVIGRVSVLPQTSKRQNVKTSKSGS